MSIQRVSLGRRALLGDLFDASTDAFCNGLSVFRQPIPMSLITHTQTRQNQVQCDVRRADSRIDRLRIMGLGAEEQLSVLAYDTSLHGSSKLMAIDACSAGGTAVCFILKIRIFSQKINIISEEVKRLISLEAANGTGATHVVVGVEWGITSVIALSFHADSAIEKAKASTETVMRLLQTMNKIIGRRCGPFQSPTKSCGAQSLRLEFYSDSNFQTPKTLDECAVLLTDTVRSLKENLDIITPQTYTLIPLQEVDLCGTKTAPLERSIETYDKPVSKKLLRYFRDATSYENSLQNLSLRLSENAQFLRKETRNDAASRTKKCLSKLELARKRLAENIRMFRIGKVEPAELETILRAGQGVFQEIEQLLLDFHSIIKQLNFRAECASAGTEFEKPEEREKLMYVAKCKESGARFVGGLKVLHEMLKTGEHFVFFAKLSQMDETFEKNSKTFEKLCGKYAARCILFNNDSEQLETIEDHHIARYVAGCRSEDNICRLDTLLEDYNVIKIDQILSESVSKPNPCSPLQVACPKCSQRGCDREKRKWTCYHCGETVVYGFNERIYCRCGESSPFSVLWCCNEHGHGLEYVEYSRAALTKQLGEIQRPGECSIL